MGWARRTIRGYRVSVALLLAAVLAGLLIFALNWHSRLYRVTILPRLGTRVVMPCSINDHSQIVGFCQGRFYLWERGKDWRELGRASERSGLYINNAGQIAGTIDDPNGLKQEAFLWDPADGTRLLGTLGDAYSEVHALNNLGQVVGESGEHAFIWDKPGGMRNLGPHSALAINDSGQVIVCSYGRYLLMESNHTDAAPIEIPPIKGRYGGGIYGINNNGYVLSQGLNPNNGRDYAFIWHPDRGIEWLFSVRGRVPHMAALNDANQVAVSESVLYSAWYKRLTRRNPRPYRQSFLWTRQRGRVLLDKYVRDRSGDYLTIAGLNNNGCVIGTVHRDTGSVFRAVLLEPIPERWGK